MKVIGLLYTGELNVSLLKKYSSVLNDIDKALKLVAFKPSNIHQKTRKITGYYFANGELLNKEFEMPGSVYNLSHNISDKLELSIGKGRVFNLLTRFDKWHIYKILKKTNQYGLPATLELSYKNILNFITIYNSIVLKPKTGSKGRGIIKVDLTSAGFLVQDTNSAFPFVLNEFDSLLQFLNTRIQESNNYIMQEFIENKKIDNAYFDVRLYVQKDGKGKWQITGGLSRIAPENIYITNITKTILSHKDIISTLYTSSNAIRLINKIESDSISTAKILEMEIGHLGELSVDFILNPTDRPYVLEVNSQPMKNIASQLDDISLLSNLYRKPMEYAKFLATK